MRRTLKFAAALIYVNNDPPLMLQSAIGDRVFAQAPPGMSMEPHNNLDCQHSPIPDIRALGSGSARMPARSHSGGNIEDALHDPSGARKIADVSSRCSVLSH